MKRFLSIAFVIIGMATASLFSGCNKGSGPVSYPDIVTVNTLLPGAWELIKSYDPQIGKVSGNGVIYTFQTYEQDKSAYTTNGSFTMHEEGNLPLILSYSLKPILQGDLDGSDSQLTVAVELFSGENDDHYMISVLSETTMKWQKIGFENGKVVIQSGYAIFSRRNDIN